jgi:hypothetical protein
MRAWNEPCMQGFLPAACSHATLESDRFQDYIDFIISDNVYNLRFESTSSRDFDRIDPQPPDGIAR